MGTVKAFDMQRVFINNVPAGFWRTVPVRQFAAQIQNIDQQFCGFGTDEICGQINLVWPVLWQGLILVASPKLVQVVWLREKLGFDGSLAMKTLEWAGVASRQQYSLEALLRFKCLILVAVSLKRRSVRWVPCMTVRVSGFHLQQA